MTDSGLRLPEEAPRPTGADRLTRPDALLHLGLEAPPTPSDCPYCGSALDVRSDRPQELKCPSCSCRFVFDPDEGAPWPEGMPRRWGRFELLKLLGAGAFGTVWKARDPQRAEEVAVKVARAGLFATDEERERFLREARANQTLRHPGIVPVYETGRLESDLYLVSELVQGVNLAERLERRHFSFRRSAEFTAAVADALQHAHSQGIVHRDVKPTNILLDENDVLADPDGADPFFRPRLMDFGLAKTGADPVTLTREGCLMGTPAYMSPEQIRHPHRVDARADVYSLSVILYELLTGDVPFRGNGPMLLRQVLEDDPRPPRQLNDRIPKGLEAIVLKGMEKDPRRRYVTAEAMAEDLRRYLADEPVCAPLPGRATPFIRWVRRNPALAVGTGLIALALSGTAISSTVFWRRAEKNRIQAEQSWGEAVRQRAEIENLLEDADRLKRKREESLESAIREQQNAQQALAETERQRRLAVENLEEAVRQRSEAQRHREETDRQRERAETNLQIAERRRLESQAHLAEAERQKKIAEDNFRRTRTAVDDFFTRVAESRLLHVPGLQPLRKELLESALTYYQGFLETRGDDPALRAEMAGAYARMGLITARIGSQADARKAYREALRRFEELIRDQPDDRSIRVQLARAYIQAGNLEEDLGHPEEALALYRKATRLPKDAMLSTESFDSIDLHMARALARTGQLEASRQGLAKTCDDLESVVRKQPEDAAMQAALGEAYRNLGIVLEGMNRLTEALAAYRNAARYEEAAVQRRPEEWSYRAHLARSHFHAARLERDAGRKEDALSLARRALILQEKLVRENPAETSFRADLAATRELLAVTFLDAGKPELAMEEQEASIALLQKIAEQNSTGPIRLDLAGAQVHLGNIHRAANRRDEAIQCYQRAREGILSVLRDQPASAEARGLLGMAVNRIGEVLDLLGRPDRALESYRESQAHFAVANETAPQVTAYREGLSRAYFNQSTVLRKMGRLTDAVNACLSLRTLWSGNAEKLMEVASEIMLAASEVEQSVNTPVGLIPEIRRTLNELADDVLREALASIRLREEGPRTTP